MRSNSGVQFTSEAAITCQNLSLTTSTYCNVSLKYTACQRNIHFKLLELFGYLHDISITFLSVVS